MTAAPDRNEQFTAPPALLAIIRAARAAGDRDLERGARRILLEQYGIELTFRRARREEEAAHA
jgi:hypothetical protein